MQDRYVNVIREMTGDAETTFHKRVSFIPEGKNNMCLMLSAVTILQIKKNIYLSNSVKCAGE